MSKTKSFLVMGAVAVAFNFTAAGRAFAVWCQADAPMVYQNLLTNFLPFLNGSMTSFGSNTEQTVTEAGASTAGEIAKATMANKAVAEGIAAYEEGENVRQDAVDLREKLTLPESSCEVLSTSAALGPASLAVQRDTVTTMNRILNGYSPASATSATSLLEGSHKTTNAKFCSPEEAALRICSAPSGASSWVAGADQDASFLFQSKDGASSYADDGSVQGEAADSFIRRVTVGVPSEALNGNGKDYYKNSKAAQAYVELGRRYKAMTSMSAFSLSAIRANAQVRPGLGADTMMDQIDAPGFEAGKRDMSMMEVVDRFVASRFSPKTTSNLLTAGSTTILREMAQTSNFQLWMAFQAQQRSSRTEALQAHQLMLINEQTLRPQIDSQRAAALQLRSTKQ